MRLIALILASVIGGFVALAILLDLFPERELTMVSGGEGSAYRAIAEEYRDALAEDGITLTLLDTAGSVENMARLVGGEADVALVQGGISVTAEDEISALATVFLEPLLIFHREGLEGATDPTAWTDLRVAAGAEGSGTRFAVETVLRTLDLREQSTALVPLGGLAASEALLADEIDVAIFVAPIGAAYLEPLYAAPGIFLASIRDVEALRRRLSFVMQADLPPASLNYADIKPATRIDLVAFAAQLAIHDGLHPALIDRLVKAARSIHGARDLISEEGQFPSTEATTLPMNKQARSLLSGPPSRLDRFMPWWMAAQVAKLALLIVPLVLLLLPLLRILPGIYGWTMRARVYKRYSDLIDIEKEAASAPAARIPALTARLDNVQEELTHMRLPEAYRDRAYTMQMHIDLVRERLKQRAGR